MRLRSFLWSKLVPAKERDPQPPEPSVAQEDPETRASIARYLRLADQAISGNPSQEFNEKDDDEAA